MARSRGGRIPGVFDRRATQPGGMHRRSQRYRVPCYRPLGSRLTRTAATLALAALLPGVAPLAAQTSFGGYYQNVPLWTGQTVLAPGAFSDFNRLRLELDSGFGDFSFSLYLIHLPIFVLLSSLLFRSSLQMSIWPSFGFMLVAVPIAYAFYRAVELPAMKWSASFKPKNQRARVEPSQV